MFGLQKANEEQIKTMIYAHINMNKSIDEYRDAIVANTTGDTREQLLDELIAGLKCNAIQRAEDAYNNMKDGRIKSLKGACSMCTTAFDKFSGSLRRGTLRLESLKVAA